MKTWMLLVVAAALVAPVAAFADGAPTTAVTANKLCKATQAAMGAKLFSQTYGANAFGKCVSKSASVAKADVSNASKTCSAEQADVNFASTHGGKTFDQFYGTTTKGKSADANAMGKCVSQAVSNCERSSKTTARERRKRQHVGWFVSLPGLVWSL